MFLQASTLEPALADIEARYADGTEATIVEDGDDAEMREEEEDDEEDEARASACEVDLAAAACSAVGMAYEALENRSRAVEWLTRALALDAKCAEAMTFLVERRLLSSADETALHASLAEQLSSGDEDEDDAANNAWIVAVYGARLCVHDCEAVDTVEDRFEDLDRTHGLGENNEVLCARAEHAYALHDARAAHALAKRVYASDPFDLACVPVYLASLVDLGLAHDLFYCAHELVKAYPKHAASWFAVGCYYLLVGKHDAAQRYFHKSAKLNPRFAPAWIGFGNAFAAQDESEQAMAAYRSASRLFQGSHVPLMYIGMEYLRTNNLPLAKHFLTGAKRLCPSDPMVSNELGVVELRQSNYEAATATFEAVLDLFNKLPERAPLRAACEASLFNLAQTYRKMHDFHNAAKYFQLALAQVPRDPAVRAALGATYHALGGGFIHKAIDCYHIALGLRPDDTFSSEMLTRALKDVLDVEADNPFAPFDIPRPGDDDDDDVTDAARDSLQRLSCDIDGVVDTR